MKKNPQFSNFNNKAFTYVELIIVITILAILWTIWYISYNWYISQSRDSSRLSQISSIYNALEWYRIKGYLPIPEYKVSVSASWELIGYQWYVGEDILNKIGYNEWWKDPETWKYYIYYIDSKQRNMEMLAYLENEQENTTYESKTILKTYAIEYATKIPKVFWDKMWILLYTDNSPIHENPSLAASWLDVVTTTETFKAIFSDNEILTWTWNVLKVIYWTTKTWIIWEDCQDYVDANGGYFLNPWYYLFSSVTSWLTQWFCSMN